MRITNTILGRMQSATTCTACNGAGQTLRHRPSGADSYGMISEEETVSIKIPAGVEDGMQLKVSGKGNEAPGQGISGDMIVQITVKDHPTLKREGNNLHFDLYISLSEAVLGTYKEIDIVGGSVRIKLDTGIQSGKILRLKGKGIPSLNHYGTGDMLVHVNVWTPEQLTKEQKQFFEHQATHDNFKPSPKSSHKSFFDKVKDMFS
jgi:molecular chaperone DnaJ